MLNFEQIWLSNRFPKVAASIHSQTMKEFLLTKNQTSPFDLSSFTYRRVFNSLKVQTKRNTSTVGLKVCIADDSITSPSRSMVMNVID